MAGGGEVHVVLRRAGPRAAPAPADRPESADNPARDHAGPDLRAVEIRHARGLACAAAARVRILETRGEAYRHGEGTRRDRPAGRHPSDPRARATGETPDDATTTKTACLR